MTQNLFPGRLPTPIAKLLLAIEQRHILDHFLILDEGQKDDFVSQLKKLDFTLLAEMRQRILQTQNNSHAQCVSSRMPNSDRVDLSAAETPACFRLRDPANHISPANAVRQGESMMRAGKVGAILVAGGQGSRLGFNGPKGLFKIGPVSQASLFEILCGKVIAVAKRYQASLPLAIMTSSATDDATKQYFKENCFFGLQPEKVFFFCQKDLPVLDDQNGKLLLRGLGQLAMAPDGHGGLLGSLSGADGLDWFAKQGVEHLVSFQVDNPLAIPFDSEFLGYHSLSKSHFTPQVIPKLFPSERVGVVITSHGITRIVEYSDLPEDMAAKRLPNGRLVFHAGSIAVHAFQRKFLERMAKQNNTLPLHMAHKSVPFIGSDGGFVDPQQPNAYKFERFLFDLMPHAETVTPVEIKVQQGFAPLKNASGASSDTAEHVRSAMVSHAQEMLRNAGVEIANDIDVELASHSIIDADDITRFIQSGSTIERPTVIGSS